MKHIKLYRYEKSSGAIVYGCYCSTAAIYFIIIASILIAIIVESR